MTNKKAVMLKGFFPFRKFDRVSYSGLLCCFDINLGERAIKIARSGVL